MKNLIATSLFLVISVSAYSQALFPKQIKNVTDSGFCMDCGDVKVDKDSVKFAGLLKFLTSHNYINKTKGTVKFQVLINDRGEGQVLSHTDTTNSVMVQNMVHTLNAFRGWKSATTGSTVEPLVSIVVAMEISNSKLTGAIQRDQNLLNDGGSFANTGKPALTRPKSILSQRSHGFAAFFIARTLVSSIMQNINPSPIVGQTYMGSSFFSGRNNAYDPFNYNKNLPMFRPGQMQQFQPGQWSLSFPLVSLM